MSKAHGPIDCINSLPRERYYFIKLLFEIVEVPKNVIKANACYVCSTNATNRYIYREYFFIILFNHRLLNFIFMQIYILFLFQTN